MRWTWDLSGGTWASVSPQDDYAVVRGALPSGTALVGWMCAPNHKTRCARPVGIAHADSDSYSRAVDGRAAWASDRVEGYDATHFTLAVPADWQVDERVGLDSTWARRHPTYILYSSQDNAPGYVYEYDGLTPAQVHDDFCIPTADDTVLTIGGLPMRFSVGYGPMGTDTSYDPFEYDWIFISNHGTVYWFDFYVDPGPPDGPIVQLDRAVIETFAPQYATWGCA